MLAFLQAHQAGLAAVAIALIDFAVELNPKLESNSLVSMVLALLGVKKAPASDPAPKV